MRTFKFCAIFLALATGVGVCPSAGVAAAQTDHTLPVLWHAQGATNSTQFGTNAAGLGDVNRDGFDDIAVVSLGDHVTYVYFGGATPDTIPDLRLRALYNVILTLGDINGDGYGDIAGSNGVSVYIYYGNAMSLDTIPGDSLVPDARGTGFGGGFGVGLDAADFDRDGLMDFVVVDGSPDLPGSWYGRILYYPGVDGYGNHIRWAIPGPTVLDCYAKCSALDLDGDTYPELVVTARGGEVGDIPGRVMVFDSSPFDTVADYRFACPPVSYPSFKWWFGGELSNIGDFNHDGFEDLAIPARIQGIIFYGGPGIWDSIPDLQLNTCAPHVVRAGDINGDGISDVIVGNLCYNASEGRGEIFLGGHPPDGDMDFWMSYQDLPKNFEENIGWVVAPAGDFNGDGVDDAILVSKNIDPWFYGDVFVLGGVKTTDVTDGEDSGSSGDGNSSAVLTIDAYPNPANSSVRFIVRNGRDGHLKLWMADILGRTVGQIADGFTAAGEHRYGWSCVDRRGNPLASGVYFAIAESNELRAVRRVILLK